MSRPARIPVGGPAAVRSPRLDALRVRHSMSRAGSGAPGALTTTRIRPKHLAVTCLAAGALALLPPAGDARAQSRIGRLFSSPEQRAELDRLREEAGAGEAAAPAPAPDPPARESRPETGRETSALAAALNGAIVRGDGHAVVWIDGIETPTGSSTPAGAHVAAERAPDGRLRIRLSLGRTTAVLAPGQFVDESGKVHDGYARPPTAVAAGTPGEDATNPDREVPNAAAPVGPPQPDSPLLPARRVREPPRETQALSAPSDEGPPGAHDPGDGQPMTASTNGRESASW